MADATLVTTFEKGSGLIRAYHFSSVATGSTFTCKENVKAWWISNKTTADAVTATFVASTGVFTITVANNPDIVLFIIS